MLADVEVRRIVSSPYLRCVQTVEPLAAALGLEIEHAPELGAERHGPDGPALLASLVGEHAVVCVHGGIEAALGLDLRFRKGAVWLFRDALDRPEDRLGEALGRFARGEQPGGGALAQAAGSELEREPEEPRQLAQDDRPARERRGTRRVERQRRGQLLRTAAPRPSR